MILTNEQFLTEDSELIHINEWNSGYSDHRDFIKVLDELMRLIKSELMLCSLTDKIDMIDVVNVEYMLKTRSYTQTWNDPYKIIKQPLCIKFSKCIGGVSQKNDLYLRGGTHLGERFTIEIGVNKEKTVGDILKNLSQLRVIISHELTHVFQNIYNNYQKTQSYYEKLYKNSSSDDIFGNVDYWLSKYEIEAYITNINTELRNIKGQDDNITFFKVMMNCQSWLDFMNHIPKDQKEKSKKLLLKKIAHYWIYNLGGKITEQIIQLNNVIYD